MLTKFMRTELWRRGVVLSILQQLHSTKPELRFCAGSNPARDVLEIYDGEDGQWQWSQLEIRLSAFVVQPYHKNNSSSSELTGILGQNAFGWSLINANWKNKIKRKSEYCCFFLYKLWTYFNQTIKFKQTGIYSQTILVIVFWNFTKVF